MFGDVMQDFCSSRFFFSLIPFMYMIWCFRMTEAPFFFPCNDIAAGVPFWHARKCDPFKAATNFILLQTGSAAMFNPTHLCKLSSCLYKGFVNAMVFSGFPFAIFKHDALSKARGCLKGILDLRLRKEWPTRCEPLGWNLTFLLKTNQVFWSINLNMLIVWEVGKSSIIERRCWISKCTSFRRTPNSLR